jgi:transcriptional regulator with XRE-family HTH domain
MNGQELRLIRRSLGLTVRELGYAIGYRGNQNTVSVAIRLYEGGKRPIPPWIGRLAAMFGKHGVPPDWTLEPDRSPNQHDGQDRFQISKGH